ncbi:hypothetical protein LINGRAHAP2_LOCUS22465 [Linum grandiflorum]
MAFFLHNSLLSSHFRSRSQVPPYSTSFSVDDFKLRHSRQLFLLSLCYLADQRTHFRYPVADSTSRWGSGRKPSWLRIQLSIDSNPTGRVCPKLTKLEIFSQLLS